MFDSTRHYHDRDGFIRDKQTNHLIGIQPAPPARHPDEGAEYPKWVTPHPSHIRGTGDHVSTPSFPDFHVNRVDGSVTVKVSDAIEERKALAAFGAQPPDPSQQQPSSVEPQQPQLQPDFADPQQQPQTFGTFGITG